MGDQDSNLKFQFYTPSNELSAAKQALSPAKLPLGLSTGQTNTEDELPSPFGIPGHVFHHSPALRDVALTAVAAGKAAHSNQQDFAILLKYGVQLQELVARLGNTAAATEDQLKLLHQACEIYSIASKLDIGNNPTALFNWAVALSDIARLVRATKPNQTAEYLSMAGDKYAAALEVEPDNPQALNNWALVLNDIQALLPPEQQPSLTQQAIHRFRAAIRLQSEIDALARFSYNLGTVLYGVACTLQEKSANFTDNKEVRAAFAHAAQYIVLSYALQPSLGASEDSLASVQRLLPLPYLRVGALQIAAPGTEGTTHEKWVTGWFALDMHGLQCVRPPASEISNSHLSGPVPDVMIDLNDIHDVQPCMDPSLPQGSGIWLATTSQPLGKFLTAADDEDAQGWIDAITLMLHLKKSEKQKNRLHSVLLARRR